MKDRILVLADDLTGALEAGAKFAGQGIRTLVSTELSLRPKGCDESIGVLVIDAETRHLPPAEAGQRVRELAHAAGEQGFRYLYKKTDSTLRGNIASELGALAEAFPGSALLYVPAYPRMGRTVKRGMLYVHGAPVSETEFARDGLNPVKASSIARVLPAGPLPVVCIAPDDPAVAGRAAQPALLLCDGETDHDLEVAAETFVQSASLRLAAGPAGFLHFLAPSVNLPREPAAGLPVIRAALVVNGSQHGVSIEQVRYAKAQGFGTVGERHMEAAAAERGWVILEWEERLAADPLEAARRAGEVVPRALAARFEALVVFGGDTACAVLRALGATALSPLGEVAEGVPISRISARDLGATPGTRGEDLYLITKAGGFDSENVLLSIKEVLAGRL
jgi:uncharacterized protein YgbK (DUF1537 family)